MAQTWRLVDLAGTAGLTYNFLATDVARQRGENWTVVDNGDGTVTDTFDLKFVDTDANIITSWKKLEAIRAQLDRFNDSQFEYNSIWYECYSASETAKRSLVTDLVIQPYKDGKYTPLLGKNALFATISITHKDFWEATSATANVVNGDTLQFIDTSAIAAQLGDLPGKMQMLVKGTGGGNVVNAWMGIKPTRYGTANFVSLWQMEACTNVADTSLAADATASGAGNNTAVIDFGSGASMLKRCYITASAVSANYDDLVGRYHVLARYKVGASTTCFIQLKAGFSSNTTNPPVGESKKADSTSWKFLELGTVDIPSLPYRNPAYPLLLPTTWTFEIWAERTAGSNNLTLDCLALIPAEHYFKVTGAVMAADGDASVYAQTLDDDSQFAYNFSDNSNYIIATPEFEFTNWWCPIEGGVLVVACEGAASLTADAVIVTIDNWPRWDHFWYSS